MVIVVSDAHLAVDLVVIVIALLSLLVSSTCTETTRRETFAQMTLA